QRGAPRHRPGLWHVLALRGRRLAVRHARLHPLPPPAMSTASEIDRATPVRHRGIKVAYVFAGSTGAWMAHLFFASSFVQYSCNAGGVDWAQHAFTAFCALVAAHATWVAYGLHREGRADAEDAGTPIGAN